MLQLFRSFMNSKLGVIITLVVLAVIALAFAIGDVAHTGTFGGITGSDRVAIVGGKRISTADLNSAVSNDFEQFRRESPTATMESFIAQGGMAHTLQQMLDRTAIAEFGRINGLRAGDRLVDSELTQIPQFHGADGKFDDKTYRALIGRQGLTDKQVRDDIGTGMLARQVMLPLSLGSEMPLPLVKRYAALLKETRKGAIGLLLSDAYAPKTAPTADQLTSYYTAHRTEYLRPERRVIRYFLFDDKSLGNLPAPTDAEIAARFKQDAAKYAASETRRMTQLVVPTKAAADAIAAEVSGGKSLDAAAREKGLAVTQIGPMSQAELAEQTSAAVAQAAFAAGQGKLATPARGTLGFYVLRIENIERKAARTLDQAKSEIATTLATEKRRTALAELSGKIEDQIDNGSSLAELAKTLKAEPKMVADVIGNGSIYGKQGVTVPDELKPAVTAAFDMQEGQPQMSEVVAGKTFLVYEVSNITPSAAAPLAEIKDTVTQAWRKSEGAKAAKLAADRVMKRIQGGQAVQAAIAAENVKLPTPDPINMNREQLAKMGDRVPPVLALMFSMAQGTTKRLEAPNNNGWFVVKLDQIDAGKIADNDPLVGQAAAQLSKAMEQEYGEEMIKSITATVGVERNESAIKTVQTQLTGRNKE